MSAIDPVALIGQVGFPIFVAIYLMVRMEKTLKELTAAMIAMKECVDKIGSK